MKKDRVMKDTCLLLIFAFVIGLAPAQIIYAADVEPIFATKENIQKSSVELMEYDTDVTTPVQMDNNASDEPTFDDSNSDLLTPDNPDDPYTDSSDSNAPGSIYETPSLNTNSLHLVTGGNSYELRLYHAIQASYQLSGENTQAIELSSESEQSVIIAPITSGHTLLTVTAIGENEHTYILTCQITVSKLSLSKDSIEIYMNDSDPSKNIAIRGINFSAAYYGTGTEDDVPFREAFTNTSQCSIQVGNNDIAKAYFKDDAIYIHGLSKGKTNIKINIYGCIFSIKVNVYHYTLNRYTINTYKGSANKTLKLRGTGMHEATWISGNKNVADVSQKGIVTIKGIGSTKITAKVNGKKLVCIVSVSSKTAYRVVKNARTISNNKNIQYSQAMRMSQNYYDCSSLVYRCYRTYGIRFGYTHPTWAPTAADEAHWCATTGHMISSQAVDLLSCKLVPGDTIYYSFNENNGRYLNIDHTAIFAGYSYDESNGYYGTVIEASSSSNKVAERIYYASDSIKLIGRPSK